MKNKILALSKWLKENYNTVIFLLVALMSIFVGVIMVLFVWGYIANGMFMMHFPIESVIQLVGVLVVQSIALATYAYSNNAKYRADSEFNSESEKPAYHQVIDTVVNKVMGEVEKK